MKIRIIILFAVYLLLISCSGTRLQGINVTNPVLTPVEVTKIVPETVVVTQLVEVTRVVLPTEVTSKSTETPSPKKTLQVILATTVVENAAEIVLIQYYTFYDYHMYPEAYQLLSSTTKSKQSYDNWVMFTQGIDHVKILELKPYNDYAKQFGFKTINDQKDLKVYFARISFIGKETGMKEQISQLFLKVALENGEWKILPAATSIS